MDFAALFQALASHWGYVGIFLVQAISSSTILLPLPGMVIVFFYGALLNPLVVGLFAAGGAAVGELTGYLAGIGGHHLVVKRNKEWVPRIRRWMKKYDPFVVVTLFAALPFPFDIIGVLSGLSRYDAKKFLTAVFIGNFVKFSVVAFGGFYGLPWVLQFFGG